MASSQIKAIRINGAIQTLLTWALLIFSYVQALIVTIEREMLVTRHVISVIAAVTFVISFVIGAPDVWEVFLAHLDPEKDIEYNL